MAIFATNENAKKTHSVILRKSYKRQHHLDPCVMTTNSSVERALARQLGLASKELEKKSKKLFLIGWPPCLLVIFVRLRKDTLC